MGRGRVRLGSLRKDSTSNVVVAEEGELVFDVTTFSTDVIKTKRGPAVMRSLDTRRMGPLTLYLGNEHEDKNLRLLTYDEAEDKCVDYHLEAEVQNFHNMWVASKVYAHRNITEKETEWRPSYRHPAPNFFDHRATMFKEPKALTRSDYWTNQTYRKKKAEREHAHPPLYFWWGGHKLTRVEARFRAFAPLYEQLVTGTLAYKALNKLLDKGKNVLLMGMSGFTMTRSVTEHMMDDTVPCKHDIVLYAILRGECPWRDRFPGPAAFQIRYKKLREVDVPAKKRKRQEDEEE